MSIRSVTRSVWTPSQLAQSPSTGWGFPPPSCHPVRYRRWPNASSSLALWCRDSHLAQSVGARRPPSLVSLTVERAARARATRGSSVGRRNASSETDAGRRSSSIFADHCLGSFAPDSLSVAMRSKTGRGQWHASGGERKPENSLECGCGGCSRTWTGKVSRMRQGGNARERERRRKGTHFVSRRTNSA